MLPNHAQKSRTQSGPDFYISPMLCQGESSSFTGSKGIGCKVLQLVCNLLPHALCIMLHLLYVRVEASTPDSVEPPGKKCGAHNSATIPANAVMLAMASMARQSKLRTLV